MLDTDASDEGLGAVLSQVVGGREHVVAYASRTLTRAEQRYCATRKEMLALEWASHHFRPYLYGRKFVLRTDHSALQWLHSLKEPEGQVARWLEGMAEFNYEVVHRPGKQHALYADALSRGQCRQCGLDFSCTEFEEEEVVMMAAEVSILPVWSNQDIRNLQKADTNLRTAMEWESQASLHSNVHKIQPGSSNPCGPRGVI